MNRGEDRNSSIELLKIFALFIIVISHSLPRYGANSYTIDFNYARFNFDYILNVFEYYFGQIGNAIFIVCSSWFLLDNSRVRSDKVRMIVTDSFVISIGYLIIFLMVGIRITNKFFIKQFFPITFENGWKMS